MTHRLLPVLAALLFAASSTGLARADTGGAPDYAAYFTDEALRVELVHSGTRGDERFALQGLVAEPLWPGPRVGLLDPTGFGEYRFRAVDQATGQEIFSQGYCSLFGEWLATPEAETGIRRALPEPVRLPMPKAPIALVLEGRDKKTGAFREIDRFAIDPAAYDLGRGTPWSFEVVAIHEVARDPAHSVDVVIVPDGYTAAEADKMLADARRFGAALLASSPFDRHADAIAVRLVAAFSRESGPDEPRKGLFRDTIAGATFDTFRSPRYLTTPDMQRLREIAALAPYDTIIVMVNSNRYGGGGIYNAFSVFTSDSEYDDYVLIHEFGHGFAALGDEYYTSSTGYDADAFYTDGVEPWEPNITAVKDRDRIKWRRLIAADVPVPTPDTAEYDGVVGLFEGAGYKAKGLFRPTRDSKMFHKGLLPFGPVNEEAIERMIRYHTGEGGR